jgi:hypothetical protein
MMSALWHDSPNDARCLCWFSPDSADARIASSDSRHYDQKTQNLVVQNPRCSFTLPIMPMLPGKMRLAAASCHNTHA